MIQMQELVEAAVTPSINRTLELQTNVGDMAELQLKSERQIADLTKRLDEELLSRAGSTQELLHSCFKKDMDKLDRKIELIVKQFE